MDEAAVIEQMVEYQNILLLGVQVFFTIVSAYVVAIWVFLRHAGFFLRLFSFFFLSLVLGFMGRIAIGSSQVHNGFIATLEELDYTVGLSPVGQAALTNSASGLDGVIQQSLGGSLVIVYIALFLLTFFARSTLRTRPGAPN
jgi:hypothetical protein